MAKYKAFPNRKPKNNNKYNYYNFLSENLNMLWTSAGKDLGHPHVKLTITIDQQFVKDSKSCREFEKLERFQYAYVGP